MKINSVDEYIEQFPEHSQDVLAKIRDVISNSSSDLEETMSYGIPTFKYKNQNLVHFAGFKNHIGFYPSPSGISAFKEEIKEYKWAKGSVQFPIEEVPYELIKRITRYRIGEIDGK